MNLIQFLLSEIGPDETETEKQGRLVREAFSRVWEAGYEAARRGETVNPYAVD